MLLTANLFPLMCFSIASVLNTVAISYHSLAAVPFGSIVVVLLIWILVSCPLCLFGTVSSDQAYCPALLNNLPCLVQRGTKVCACPAHVPEHHLSAEHCGHQLSLPGCCALWDHRGVPPDLIWILVSCSLCLFGTVSSLPCSFEQPAMSCAKGNLGMCTSCSCA